MLPHRLPQYAELHCRSNFSFLTGASHPEELVRRAFDLGYSALALTDECSLAGVVRGHVKAKELGLHFIVGSEMQLTTPEGAPHARLVVLAQTRRGYGNLSQWITVARRRAAKGQYLAYPGDLQGAIPNAPFLAGLPECLVLLLPGLLQPLDDLLSQALWLKAWCGERAGLLMERLHLGGEDEVLVRLQQVHETTGLALVAAGGVLMHRRSRKPLQDVLTATRLKLPVAQCGWQLQANAEAHLRSRLRLQALYPAPALAQTVVWAERCTFSLDELRYEYPQELVPAGTTPSSHLRALTESGALKRYPSGVPPKVRAQIEHELALIEQLHYEPYFLTVADIVRWARDQGILCQGRGSAANSAVCFCLQITEVNPATMTLLFERFISAERGEPPDIDVDFEHQRREEVIQYIYRKYGRHRAALTAVVTTYRPRSALRDVGRALGIDLQRIDAVAKSQQWFDGKSIDPERLRENGFDPAAHTTRLWMELTEQLIGFPRHLSQHPGGFVIASEQIAQLVPVENAAMPGRSVVQWDKDDLDALGILKVDILALGMLTALRRALLAVSQKLGLPETAHLRLSDIPVDDAATFEMACRADTVGVFQIESRAQMSMLPRLQPRCFYDLVIEVAIVRPGPIQGGMVHPYLRRRSGEEPVTYPSPEVAQALQRTLGVLIFQEQVMQLAVLAADFTPGEADQLRRAMAAWKRKGGLGPFHERLVGRMVAKGYAPEFAESIFKQIQGFGEYGFPESHAISFALLVLASCWIKCHHPDAFLAALLNSQPMGFYAPAQLVRDARAHGVAVLPVDVQSSEADSSLVPPSKSNGVAATRAGLWPVRLGLNQVAGLSRAAASRITQAREQRLFSHVDDLAQRAELNTQDLQALAAANALESLAGHRHQAAWAVAGLDTRPTALLAQTRRSEASLPYCAEVALAPPNEAQAMLADYRSLGLTLNRHPVAMLRPELAQLKVVSAEQLQHFPHGRLARASGLVTHRQRPPTAKGVVFVTLEDETGAINVIVWPQVAQSQRKALLGARLMTVFGRWQQVGGVAHLLAQRLIDHSDWLQGLSNRSRDFH
ncbi:MAG: error-prone DNA polymerase [Burkholderiales bacterium]